jgi:hypothetical protein
MKRRTKWLVVCAIGMGTIAGIYLAGPRQPSYQGRSLDEWLGDLENPHFRTQQVARAAIRAMGPSAVPFLTNSLDQRKRLSVRETAKKILPRRVVDWGRSIVKPRPTAIESHSAAVALQALGPDATSAIPSLVLALSDGSMVVPQAAVAALGAMGAAATPSVRERLSASDPVELIWVLRAVAALGTNAAPAATEVGAIVLNPLNPAVAIWASAALGQIGPAAIPATEALLQSTNREAKLRGLSVLAAIGRPAIAATNALFKLTRSEDAEVRLRARQTLGGIYPPREVALPIWREGLRDPDTKNVEASLRFVSLDRRSVHALNQEIARLTLHPTNSIRESASNALTQAGAWPK